MPMKVFVTDGDERPALASARALGRRGDFVVVGSDQRQSLAGSSRYCRRHVSYPSPLVNRQAFDDFLLDFVERERIDVLVPVTDVTMHAACVNQGRLRRFCALAVPPLEAFELVTDKRSLLEAAAQSGIPVPRTHVIEGIAGLKTHIDRIEYPAVVKPSRSRIRTEQGWRPASVHYAWSERDLWRLYRDIDYLASYPSLIQERIVGSGVGVFGLFDRGHLIAAFAHRRLREKPPAGGVSVLCESIPLDPDLRAHAIRLLGPRGWHGVAMLEFKQDSRSGQFFLMEINGRFWGSLQLAIDAGASFPVLACDLALGRRPDRSPLYAIGVKSRWLLGDLDHLLLRLLKKDRDLHLAETAPSRLRVIADFLKFVEPNLHYDVLDVEDPRPFVHELRQSVGAMTRSATQRARSLAGRVKQPPCSQLPEEYESRELAG